ncbi:MAG: heme exporter protein CcmB [Gemmatimonadetes bacterium]|nr:heme exporter protein CcmB [Gemmatimonadota bacterium]MCH8934395.1 heme exporter protein CcmB [Gemmatimonadota bacterium]MCH8938693.1 heme exporter protein CcmB [Gemmatimonadota bacterium]
MADYARVVWAIIAKDAMVEWRTKTAFLSAMVFAILVLSILFFARDPTAVSSLDVAPGALWVTFTFAAMVGLNRAFLLERENGAMDGMLLTPIPRTAIFVGKMGGNLLFVALVEAISIPLFILFYNVSLAGRLPQLILVTAMATVAFVAVGTLLSAMVVRTRFAELMLPVLLLPFLIPPVVSAVQVTARILAGRPLSEMMPWLKLLAGFDIVFCVLTVLLFEATLDE